MLTLGRTRDDDATEVGLPPSALLRHVLALGSSGSGKTVFCKVVVEEAVRSGIPVIAVDPQGDIVSLALAGDEAELTRRGVSLEAARLFRERADVVVFTPASSRGIPLCADPVENLAPERSDEALASRTRVAAMVASLLGYDPASDDGSGLTAVLDRCLGRLAERADRADGSGGGEMSLAKLGQALEDAAAGGFADYTRYLEAKKIRAACQRLARLDVGARRLLFSEGLPVDIEALLGLGAHATEGRVRIAVIYLNTLHSQEDKDLIVATLADRLYRFMLRNPSPTPQALFYIDEVAPFVPPVRKPACKEGLTLLFKQARKYGIGCLMATQNPGDVDYRAMGQFGTWALGRLSTRQDVKKIEPSVRALAPTAADAIVRELPRLGPGEIILLNPDHFDAPVPLATRWLYGEHRTVDEEGLAEVVTDEQRARFAPLLRSSVRDETATRPVLSPAERPVTKTPVPPAPTPTFTKSRPPDLAADPPAETAAAHLPPDTLRPPPAAIDAPDRALGGPDPLLGAALPPRAHTLEVSLDGVIRARDEERSAHLAILAASASMSAKEFADRAGVGVSKARRLLAELIDGGAAARFRRGRGYRYWATSGGGRPDLGLPAQVPAFAATLGEAEAEALAEQMARGRVLGILGDAEHRDSVQLHHRLLYRIDFDEKVPPPLLARFLKRGEDVLEGSVYLHPLTLDVLVVDGARGLSFVADPDKNASAVDDLDGVAALVDVPPGTLSLVDEDHQNAAEEPRARARFDALFDARPRGFSRVFVPVFRMRFSQNGGKSVRVVDVDAILGKPVEWP